MRMRKSLFFLVTFLFVSSSPVAAQSFSELPPPPENPSVKNFHGRRFTDNEGPFALLGMQIYSSLEQENTVIIELYFNNGINPNTVNCDSFTILSDSQEQISISEDSIYFTKNTRGIRLVIPSNQKITTIKVQNIHSFGNEEMKPEIIENVEMNSRYHLSRKEQIWKKS